MKIRVLEGTQRVFLTVIWLGITAAVASAITVQDASFESPRSNGPSPYGEVFQYWPGWVNGTPAKMEISSIAHSNTSSGRITVDNQGLARFFNEATTIDPGRYRFTFYLRALDVTEGDWGQNLSINFYDTGWYRAETNFPGTYDWRKVSYVADVTGTAAKRIYIGLESPGRLWVDDVSVELVDTNIPTSFPSFDETNRPIVLMEPLGDSPVHCTDCSYLNPTNNIGASCYACGTKIPRPSFLEPMTLFSFEADEPQVIEGSVVSVVTNHVTDGFEAILLQSNQVNIITNMDWTEYDYLKMDIYVEGNDSIEWITEISDQQSADYWSRVNNYTLLFPGTNELVMPTQSVVGEKSSPGRGLLRDQITSLSFSLPDGVSTNIYVDHIRLERDSLITHQFEGLYAFDFGPFDSPLMAGMTRASTSMLYSEDRGFGFSNATLWLVYRADVLQPDALYRDFVNIEAGDFVVDLTNGVYHVFLNVDSPGGYWGEMPVFSNRTIQAEGIEISQDTMDRDGAISNYFRFSDSEDRYSDNVFDKYFDEIFQEKEFDVEITDGQLNLTFEGPNWANSLSTVIIYPTNKAVEGAAYLEALREARRFEFDHFFKRVLHADTTTNLVLTAEEEARGYALFAVPTDVEVYPNTMPTREQCVTNLTRFGFSEETEPVPFSIRADRDLDQVAATITNDLQQGSNSIPISAIKIGYISNRLKRMAADGSSYTVAPRYVMNTNAVEISAEETRRFWITIRPPLGTPAGTYTGQITLTTNGVPSETLDLEFDVISATPLESVDIPVGGFGWEIRGLPWYDDEMTNYYDALDLQCMELMQQSGLTTFSTSLEMTNSGSYTNLTLDFIRADQVMDMAKSNNMQRVVSYGTSSAFGSDIALYTPQTSLFGFSTQSNFYSHIFGLVQDHSITENWLPITFIICDEPTGDGDIANAIAMAGLLSPYKSDQIDFYGITSMTTNYTTNHQELVEALPGTSYNLHDEWSIDIATTNHGTWSFYNGGSRWNFGHYMFMLKQNYEMHYRIAWHWNINVGDPYFALDCREDDYSWVNVNTRGELVESMAFQEIREGVDDYRYLLTLQNLVNSNPTHTAAIEGQILLDQTLALLPADDRRDADGETGYQGDLPFDPQDVRREMADYIRILRGENTPPVITNLPVTEVTSGSATLNGQVVSLSGRDPLVIICWGDEDGGTSSTSDWDHVVFMGSDWTNGELFSTNLILNTTVPIYYRAYSSTSEGEDWADNLVVFDYTDEFLFIETFETNSPMAGTLGPVNGQHGWVSDIAVVQNEEAYEFDQAVIMSNATLSHVISVDSSNVWVSFAWKPGLGDATNTVELGSEALFWPNTNSTLSATSNQTLVVVSNAVINTNLWSRMLVHCDYSQRQWSLWQNGTKVIENFGFYADTSPSLTNITFRAASGQTWWLDDITIETNVWNPTPGDTDGDGMQDEWERSYWQSVNLSDDATDSDADGSLDVQEYIADTDPTNATNYFKIKDFDLSPNGSNRILRWNSATGRLYGVWQTASLMTSFTSLATDIEADFPVNSYTDTVYNTSNSFYRIDVKLSE